MFESAIEVLNIIENNGFKAYIVGGYVRDLYIGRKSKDIDISTNAKPMDLNKIFNNLTILEDYGAVKLSYKGYVYDITTFRKDTYYDDSNRKNIKIEYTDNIEEDILRRDFNINTLYMDKHGNIIDMLNAKNDIDNKIIKVNGNSLDKLKEDPLRILRAIKYATILNFNLDKKLLSAIKKYRKLLSNLSCFRIKEELTRIFMNSNCCYGFKLITSLKIDKQLKIKGLNSVRWCSDVLGIWAQLDYSEDYKFSNLEKDTINKIRKVISSKKIDEYTVYKYGNYISSVCAEILKIDTKYVNDLYNNLKIYEKKDINISANKICEILNIEPSSTIKDIMIDLEEKIVYNKLSNDEESLENYIKNKYGKE